MRDVAVASFCARAGGAVVPPSRELPPGPHERGGEVFTFSEYVEHERGREAEPAELGHALAELHAVLAHYDGPALPFLSPAIDDALDVLHVLERRELASHDEIASLRAAVKAARPGVDNSTLPVQALHGDAHRRNALCTEHGVVWNDFEDTCAGP